MLAEESLLIRGLVVDHAERRTVKHQLLLVLRIEQIVPHIVAPVTEHILKFEVGVGGSSIFL